MAGVTGADDCYGKISEVLEESDKVLCLYRRRKAGVSFAGSLSLSVGATLL